MVKDVIAAHDVELIRRVEEKQHWIASIFTGLRSGF